jgi:hypothetical protein
VESRGCTYLWYLHAASLSADKAAQEPRVPARAWGLIKPRHVLQLREGTILCKQRAA